ncbi:4'-phosphopantetheinyl transferase [Corynebacterium sp.]|uniref:4'-phosphopantetheinyl transferase family protein n=1 Tax=Corynebacterium sp. TaxID=1720 RepID=UPI0026DB3E97|nr:4'-phosphopantetheinyl transferase superfamily protein [Corynebacterium sp.]MDO4914100.1 4'-phosphopantetheinyl transferase superfamily protein [Corynebacterium sp.]
MRVPEPTQPSRNAQWPSVSRRNWDALHPQERAYVSDAVPLRRAQFADARACARNAVTDLTGHDHADTVIGKGERGMPLFPRGVVGSLTHTTGFRAAVVARTDTLKSVGVDAEVAKPLPDGVPDAVLTPRDLQHIAVVQQHGRQHVQRHGRDPEFSSSENILETVVFSAKEALYKSWFPLALVFLDFAQADIELHHDGTLTAFVHHDVGYGAMPRTIPGRWMVDSGYVVTSTWITSIT